MTSVPPRTQNATGFLQAPVHLCFREVLDHAQRNVGIECLIAKGQSEHVAEDQTALRQMHPGFQQGREATVDAHREVAVLAQEVEDAAGTTAGLENRPAPLEVPGDELQGRLHPVVGERGHLVIEGGIAPRRVPPPGVIPGITCHGVSSCGLCSRTRTGDVVCASRCSTEPQVCVPRASLRRPAAAAPVHPRRPSAAGAGTSGRPACAPGRSAGVPARQRGRAHRGPVPA